MPIVVLLLCLLFNFGQCRGETDSAVEALLVEHQQDLDHKIFNDSMNLDMGCRGLNQQPDACLYVEQNCGDLVEGYFNYLKFHYCTMKRSPASFIILAAWMIFIFYVVGSTSDNFFCTALLRVSSLLKLSPNVAGVTFLAIGNGAPDIFSSFAAINNRLFPQALGELMGAAVFVTTAVVGSVTIFSSYPVIPTRRPFLRDIGFFLGGIFLVVLTMWDHLIQFYEAFSLVLYYLLYVLVVILGRVINQQNKSRKRKILDSLAQIQEDDEISDVDSDGEDVEDEFFVKIHHGSGSHKKNLLSPVIEGYLDDDAEGKPLFRNRDIFQLKSDFTHRANYLSRVGIIDSHNHRVRMDDKHLRSLRRASINPGLDDGEEEPIEEMKRVKSQGENGLLADIADYLDWNEMNLRQKIVFCILSPVHIARHLSIPCMDEEKYLRELAMIQPFTISIFAPLMLNVWHLYIGVVPVWPFLLVIGACFSIFYWFFTRRNPEEPPKFYAIAYTLLAILMSVVWIYITANELVTLLEAAGKILGVSSAIMGLTVLAWGNSIADLVSNTMVARKGFPQMAIGACYAAPLCNTLLGLGISFMWNVFKKGSFIIDDTDIPNTVFWAMAILVFGLLTTLLVVSLNSFVFRKWFGAVTLCTYLAFSALGILSTANVLLPNTNLFARMTA